ncbi:MAG: hypothetical protein JEZ04_22205 [Spirochaetales bacterium]|nr:hypothetical protein [Spirochaetales bacterium]
MNNKKSSILLFLVISFSLLVIGCSGVLFDNPSDSGDTSTADTLSGDCAITAFTINGINGAIDGTDISLTLPYGTDLTNLVASFVTSGQNVTVSEVEQISGQTANNFSIPVEHTVYAENGDTEIYTVTACSEPYNSVENPNEGEEEASLAVYWMTGYDTHNVYGYDSNWEYTGTNYSLVDLVNANGQVYWGDFGARDITQDSDGNWYVVDNVYDDVWKFNNDWTYTGEHYDLTSQETSPEGIAFGSDGYLYAVGWSSDTVFKYSFDGVYTGTSYDISAQSNYPTGIYQDLEGYWWVLDSLVDKVFKYNSNWAYTGTSYTTKFGSPIVKGTNGYGMFQDSDRYWYISDIADDAVNQYNSDWEYTGNSFIQLEDGVMAGIIEDRS